MNELFKLLMERLGPAWANQSRPNPSPGMLGGSGAMVGAGQGMSMPNGPQMPHFLSGMQIRPNQPNQGGGPVPNLHAAGKANMPPIGGNYGSNPQPSPTPTASPLLGGPNASMSAGQGIMAPRVINTVDQKPLLPPNPMPQSEGISSEGNLDDMLSRANNAADNPDSLRDILMAQQVPAPNADGGQELPYQTYERLTGQKWTGGMSPQVLELMNNFGIDAEPGSAEANMMLQKILLGRN